MNKYIIISLLATLPLFTLAGENDSLSTMYSDSTSLLADSTDSVNDVADLETIEEVVVLENCDNAIYLSYEITPFELNKIPVDEDLFRYHVSTRNFQVSMDFNHLVKTQIDYFGTRWQTKLKEMVTKSQYFFPLYEEILSEYNMPLEIKYLSIIESGLNPYARSRSGAVGAWQFMPATGKIFDLEINSKIDERRSLEKSTRAACIYLNQMHDQYGDWLVALASYNCGPGNVRKAMRLSGKSDFWGIYKYLPRETQNYVPKFIAMTYMMNFYDEYGIVPSPYDNPLFQYQKVYCKEGLNFEVIAEMVGMKKALLLQYNPELKVAEIPYKGDGYELNLPYDVSYLFYDNEDQIVALSVIKEEERKLEEARRPTPRYYTVRRGESLGIIARKMNCSVSQLKQWNGIKGSLIYPNQRLKVYRT
ncbi:MAG: membrane-bound lytic murein transglycosylase D [Bacteroidia bacterium]|jgi:membrane-bound lytic murein transglycosylase D